MMLMALQNVASAASVRRVVVVVMAQESQDKDDVEGEAEAGLFGVEAAE